MKEPEASGFDTGALAPAGTFVATCLDVQDQFGVDRPKFENPQEIEKLDVTRFLFGFRGEDGQTYKVQTFEFRISGSPKSNLFKLLTSWLGHPPKYGWDYCELRGQGAMITVAHRQSREGTKTYANMVGISPVIDQLKPQVLPLEAFAQAQAPAPPAAPQQAWNPAVDPQENGHSNRSSLIMAVLKKDQSQSTHWYKADGSPCHRLPRAGGDGLRPTTLRDAKRLRLFPGVTSILGIFAKPQLDKWKMRQVALASMCLDRTEGESDDYFADRIIEEAFAQVEQAADLGSRIHEALEKHFEGVPVPDDLTVYTRPVFDWKEAKQLEFVERELCLVNKAHGFAGTMDVACRYGREGMGAIDFKTRKTKPGVEVMPYDGQAMQIAAYGATYWGEGNLPRLFGAKSTFRPRSPVA